MNTRTHDNIIKQFSHLLDNKSHQSWKIVHVEALRLINEIMRIGEEESARKMIHELSVRLEELCDVNDFILVIGLVSSFAPFETLLNERRIIVNRIRSRMLESGIDESMVSAELKGIAEN